MEFEVRSLYKNIFEWLAGPTGSIVIHVVFILLLFLFVGTATKETTTEIEVKVVEIEDIDLSELEDLEPPDEMPEPPETVTPPDVDMDLTPPPDIQEFTAAQVDVTPANLEIASDAFSPLILKGLAPGNMQNRTGEGRKAAIGTYGGKWGEYAEAAVLRALEWLRINQNPDGSWGTNSPDKEGFTGLALLTYLAHGETTASEKYGQTVEKAIRYLMSRQNDKGGFIAPPFTGGPKTYAHAIATYAISEAYALTRIPSIKPCMERAIQVLLDGQKHYKHGGWQMYAYDGSDGYKQWDISLSAFCVQALKAAYSAGADNPNLREGMDRAADFLIKHQKEDGSFPYSPANPGRQPNMTGAAVLSLQLLGYGNDKATQRGLGYMRDADANWKRPGQAQLYSWYYVTQAKFHLGGTEWRNWNNKVAPNLITNQHPDGYWISPSLTLKGDGVTREDRGKEINTKVYGTTLAALTLQVYYRFLPTYQPVEEKVIDQTSDTDVTIEIL
jgi:hypothetical protein